MKEESLEDLVQYFCGRPKKSWLTEVIDSILLKMTHQLNK